MFYFSLRPELFLQPLLLAEASQWISPKLLIFTKLWTRLSLSVPALHLTRLKQDTGRCIQTMGAWSLSPWKARQVLRGTCSPLRADFFPFWLSGSLFLHASEIVSLALEKTLHICSTSVQLQTSSSNIQSSSPSNHNPPLCHRLRTTFFSSALLKVFPANLSSAPDPTTNPVKARESLQSPLL